MRGPTENLMVGRCFMKDVSFEFSIKDQKGLHSQRMRDMYGIEIKKVIYYIEAISLRET
jgi:hypothetical protein